MKPEQDRFVRFSLADLALIGRLGKDPEIRTTTSGQAVVNFIVAPNEVWTDTNETRQEKNHDDHSLCFSGV